MLRSENVGNKTGEGRLVLFFGGNGVMLERMLESGQEIPGNRLYLRLFQLEAELVK